jgi:hypothetical protein
MAKKQAAWWLIGHTPRAAAYGTAVADGSLTKWYRTDDPILLDYGGEEVTDENEVKGYDGVSEDGVYHTKSRATVTVATEPSLELIGHFLAQMFGNVATTGAADPWTHVTIQPGLELSRPYSTSMITGEDRFSADSTKKHNGVVPTSINLSWSQDTPEGSMSVGLLTDGEPAVSAVSVPAVGTSLRGSRVRLEHFVIQLGPQGAMVNVSALVRGIEISMESSYAEEQRASRGTKLGTIFYPELGVSVQTTLILEGIEGDARWEYWNAETLLELDLTATVAAGPPARSFKLTAPAVWIPREAGQIASIDGGIVPILTLPLRKRYKVASATAYTFTTVNDVPAYMAAPA